MKCFMMIGVPGSGKSYEAKRIARLEDAIIVSSDAIRGELYGDESCQNNPKRVFELVDKRVREALESGRSVIMDATNITGRHRSRWVSKMKTDGIKMIAVVMETPLELCFERQNLRDRKVPEDVIRRMYWNLQGPTKEEGWDEIHLVYPDGHVTTFKPMICN